MVECKKNRELRVIKDFFDFLMKKCKEGFVIISIDRLENEYITFMADNKPNHDDYEIYGYSNVQSDKVFSANVKEYPDNTVVLVEICCWQENCGIGSKGLDAVKKYAKLHGCKEIFGIREGRCDTTQEKLFHFYDKNGFKQEGRKISFKLQ